MFLYQNSCGRMKRTRVEVHLEPVHCPTSKSLLPLAHPERVMATDSSANDTYLSAIQTILDICVLQQGPILDGDL